MADRVKKHRETALNLTCSSHVSQTMRSGHHDSSRDHKILRTQSHLIGRRFYEESFMPKLFIVSWQLANDVHRTANHFLQIYSLVRCCAYSNFYSSQQPCWHLPSCLCTLWRQRVRMSRRSLPWNTIIDRYTPNLIRWLMCWVVNTQSYLRPCLSRNSTLSNLLFKRKADHGVHLPTDRRRPQ